MSDKPKLSCTRNYDIFEMHANNRPLHGSKVLVESMRKYGFMPSSPIQCTRDAKTGRLVVIRGHNRLDCAKRLGLPVWYIVDDSNVDIFELEGSFSQLWTVNDFVTARASAGDADCQMVLQFKQKHGMTIGAAASLVGGETAGSSNKMSNIRRGTFKASEDQSHAATVARIVDTCRNYGVTFATRTAFVTAISRVLRVPEFDVNVFLHKVKQRPKQLARRTRCDEFIAEIEELYNFGARERRLALAFRVKEVFRDRNPRNHRPLLEASELKEDRRQINMTASVTSQRLHKPSSITDQQRRDLVTTINQTPYGQRKAIARQLSDQYGISAHSIANKWKMWAKQLGITPVEIYWGANGFHTTETRQPHTF